MPKARTYTVTDLIETYIQAHRKDHIHVNFTTYYTHLLALLQELFQMNLDTETDSTGNSKPLLMLFRATADSYMAIRTPGSQFLEGGLIICRLESLGGAGAVVLRTSTQIGELTVANKKLHIEMMEQILVCMYGATDKIITSTELYQHGFDDATEPQLSDYWDYY